MDKPRCLLLTPSLYWGGAEQWMYDLVKNSYQWIDWVGVVSQSKINNDDNMIKAFLDYCPVFLYGDDTIKVAIDGANPDLVLCWGKVNIEYPTNKNIPVVWCAHGCGQYDSEAYQVVRPFKPHLTAVSTACYAIFSKQDLNNVTVIFNGIDKDRCKITRTREEIRKELNVSDDKFIVGYLGRIVPEKNLLTLAYAISILPKNFIGVFVGDGWDYDNQVKAIRKVLKDRAIFTGRKVDIGNYYNAFDCFILPSLREGFSMAMLEAMYCGVPCLLTEVGILPYLKTHFGVFWISLALPPTSNEIAEKIKKIAKNPEPYKELAKCARSIVEKNFIAPIMAKNWTKYIYKILGLEFKF